MQDYDAHKRQVELSILRWAGVLFRIEVYSFATEDISRPMSYFGGGENDLLHGDLDYYFSDLHKEGKIEMLDNASHREDNPSKQRWALTEAGRQIALDAPPLLNPALVSLVGSERAS